MAHAQCADLFKDVADWYESPHIDLRPDLALYPDSATAREAYTYSPQELKSSSVSGNRKPHVARCAWAWMKLFVEVKQEPADAGYMFGGKGLLRDSHKGLASWPNRIMLGTTLVMYFVAAVKWALCFAIVWGDFVTVLPRTLELGASNATVVLQRHKLNEMIFASQIPIVINVCGVLTATTFR